MLTTTDYLKLSPWEALIEIINQKYFLDLDSATTKMLAFTPGVGTRTAIQLSADRSTRPGNLLPPSMNRTFHYDRLDLTAYFGADPVVIPGVRAPISTHTLVTRLSAQTGIVFDKNDFVNEIVMTDAQLADYTLLAHPRSLRWVGTLRLTGSAPRTALDTAVTQANLTQVLALSHNQPGKLEGPHAFMPYDFTVYRHELRAIKPNRLTLPPKRLAAILNDSVSGLGPWVVSGDAVGWNLAHDIVEDEPVYRVLHNGLISARWSPRDDSRYVLVLQLSPTLCTNVGGHLLLHYR